MHEDVRLELEAAVQSAVARVGVEGIERSALVQPFLGRGPSRATLYRWINAFLATDRTTRPDRATAEASVRDAIAAAAAGEVLPPPVTMEFVADATGTFMDRLDDCVAAARLVLSFAKTDDGRVRNAKLLLAASEHMRRCVDTMARVREAVVDDTETERFHQAVFTVVRRASPELAAQLITELRELNARWSMRAAQ